MPKSVLILCTGNSCRSQIAEGFWNQLGEGLWEAVSAGSNPAGYVHPLAIEVMKETGIDLSDSRSKSLNEFGQDQFDLVVFALVPKSLVRHFPVPRRRFIGRSTTQPMLWDRTTKS